MLIDPLVPKLERRTLLIASRSNNFYVGKLVAQVGKYSSDFSFEKQQEETVQMHGNESLASSLSF